MKPRKTFDVEQLRLEVNRRNRESTCSPEVREGWNDILSTILMETNNYHGFGYLDSSSVPEGHESGIIFDDSPAHNHVFPDESRRVYY